MDAARARRKPTSVAGVTAAAAHDIAARHGLDRRAHNDSETGTARCSLDRKGGLGEAYRHAHPVD
jgi:hypothetical protein